MRRVLRAIAAVLTLVAGAWTVRLLLYSGVTTSFAGLHIQSNDPLRPFIVTVAAFVVFALTGGLPILAAAWRRLLGVWPAIRYVPSSRVLAAVVVATMLGIGVEYSTKAAAGSDSSGYVSQADRWLREPLRPPQPWVGEVPWPNATWTFTPLGYRPIDNGPPWRQAPTYSPGLPMLMAAAKVVGGQTGLFLVVPICGALLVLATYGVGRRIRGPTAGVIAAWLMATSPSLLWINAMAWSDVPVAAAWMCSLYFLLGENLLSVAAAGLCAAIAILVRPNLFFLAPIMGLWFLIRAGTPPPTWPRRVRDVVVFGLFTAPGFVFVLLLYDFLFGSPFVSGYGRFSDMLDPSHVAPNLRLYTHWALTTQPTMTVLGLIGLATPFFWPRGNPRRAVVVGGLMFLAVAGEYIPYLVFHVDEWTYLRFFLPVWPWLALGTAAVAATLLERVRIRAATATVVIGILGLGVMGVRTARDRIAFDLWHGERRFVAVATTVRNLTPPNSAVFAMEHSGALRYYSGRVPIRYDMLDGDWLDRAVAWLADRGVHSYAVLDAWEVDEFRRHFPGQQLVDVLKRPVFVYHAYREGAVVYLYDLTTPPPAAQKPIVVNETDPGRWRDHPPGPVPTLVFQRSRP